MTSKNRLKVSSANTRVRFEQWARNPQCDANTMSAVLNVPMGAVAKSLGHPSKKAISPFAVIRGYAFEKYLFESDASRIREPLEKQGVLPRASSGFEDFRLKMNGGKVVSSVEEAIVLSEAFLVQLAAGEMPNAPTIVSGLTLRLSKGVMLPEATLILDVMAVNPLDGGRWVISVGEIKVFPDRGGYTDPGHLASARAQAGVYKNALEEWLEARGYGTTISVSDKGFLVFTWPGSTFPVVRANEDLLEQAHRAKRGFNQMDQIAQRILGVTTENYDPDNYIEWVAHSQTEYRETCWSFCDLAPRCHDLAIEQDRGIILGSEVSRALGGITLTRAIELLNGSIGANEFEQSLKNQLRTADWD